MVEQVGVNSIASQLGLTQANEKVGQKTLGQDDFLKILITQLEHQDPFDPQDNGEFIAQMASFGTVEGIGKLQESFSSLSQSLYSNQALQASALVGRTVEVPSKIASFDQSKSVEGAIKLDVSMNDVEVNVKDAMGKTVRTLHLGRQSVGSIDFAWDGKDEMGNTLPVGQYVIQADGQFNNGRMACETFVRANVDSVTLGQQGRELTLSLQGLGEVNFSDIHKIT